MIIKKSKGCLYLLLDSIENVYLDQIEVEYRKNQQDRDNNMYHITIINSTELNTIEFEESDLNINFINLGLSKLQKDKNTVYYLFIYSDDLNEIRKKFGLEPKYFHITLGFKYNDIHDKDKSLNNIFFSEYIEEDYILNIKDEYIKNYFKLKHYYPKLLIKELKKDFVKYKSNILSLIENNNYLGYLFKYRLSDDKNDLYKAIELYDYNIHNRYDPKGIGTNNLIKKVNNMLTQYQFYHIHLNIQIKLVLQNIPSVKSLTYHLFLEALYLCSKHN